MRVVFAWNVGLALGAQMLFCSCAHRAPKQSADVTAPTIKPVARAAKVTAPRTIEPVPAAPEQRLGMVRVIGAHGSFVLIQTPSAAVTAAVPAGYLLHCRPPGIAVGGSSADLRVSPERRQPFLVADVVSGLPTVGDVVFLAQEPAPVSVPLRPIVPFSSVIPAAAPPPVPEAIP